MSKTTAIQTELQVALGEEQTSDFIEGITGVQVAAGVLDTPTDRTRFLRNLGFLPYDNSNVKPWTVFIHFDSHSLLDFTGEPCARQFAAMSDLVIALMAYGPPDAVMDEDGEIGHLH